MQLRKHQREFKEIIDGIIAGSEVNTIYAHVTPGGGKSLIPILAGKLIERGRADKIGWIAPRLSLLDQAEREFINPEFRKFLGHRLQIRSAVNEINPTRGLNGLAETYQAIGVDEGGILQDEFRRRRWILVLDEFHHVEQDSLWHAKLEPLWKNAAFRILMTGTCQRGDDSRIAFMPYRPNIVGLQPDLSDGPETKVVRYTRRDALREKAIIPLSFHLSDGKASWTEETGEQKQIESIDRVRNEADAAKAIYTALKTEFAEELMTSGISHWMEHRKVVPHAKCLIVCSDIAHAKRHMEMLKRIAPRVKADIATSSDSAAAMRAISAIKRDQIDALVAVAMIYEGLSIESVSHIIILTRVRSVPWIEQCVARANRIDKLLPYRGQMGHIFAPADMFFKDIVKCIEQEQIPILTEQKREEDERSSGKKSEGFSLEPSPGGIKPLSSSMTTQKQVVLDGPEPTLFDDIGETDDEAPVMTASEREAELRDAIKNHIGEYAFKNRFSPKKINGELFDIFGKPREQMTLEELETVLAHVRGNYPLSRIRGTGHPRVPNKAVPYQCSAWRV